MSWPRYEDKIVCLSCVNVYDYVKDRHRLRLIKSGRGTAWLCEDCPDARTPKGGGQKMNVKGNIYFIHAPVVNRVKIGFATNVHSRFKALNSVSPVELKLLGFLPNKTMEDERFLHVVFDDYREKHEWFALSNEIKEFLEEELDILVSVALK